MQGLTRKSVRDKLYMSSFLLMLLFGAIFIAIINVHMKNMVLEEAVRLSQVLANQNLAIHGFINEEQKPAFFRVWEPYSKDEFIPEFMSSTYMIRRINTRLRATPSLDYYYKEVAVNARSPENEASDYEISILEQLRSEEINEYQGIINFQGQKQFVYMLPGEIMDEGCLHCHGNPIDAPKQLAEIYGDQLSFYRTPGELLSALSIRIPLRAAYAYANQTTFNLALFYIALLVLLYLLLSYLVNRVIINPIAALDVQVRDKFKKFRCDGEDIPLAGDEVENVSEAFNFLQAKLDQAYQELELYAQGLEENVRSRTQEFEEANAKLQNACQNDWLLGILNRGTFEERARAEFDRAKRENSPISFLMIDLDHFKQYNDIYGHQKGDEALQAVVEITSRQVRTYDLFGRFGGEELILCLPGTHGEQAKAVAARIVESVYAACLPHVGNPPYGYVTVSAGVASSDDAAETDFEKIINQADDNMYKAKQHSRNTFSA